MEYHLYFQDPLKISISDHRNKKNILNKISQEYVENKNNINIVLNSDVDFKSLSNHYCIHPFMESYVLNIHTGEKKSRIIFINTENDTFCDEKNIKWIENQLESKLFDDFFTTILVTNDNIFLNIERNKNREFCKKIVNMIDMFGPIVYVSSTYSDNYVHTHFLEKWKNCLKNINILKFNECDINSLHVYRKSDIRKYTNDYKNNYIQIILSDSLISHVLV